MTAPNSDPPIGPIEAAGPYRSWSSRQRQRIAAAIKQDLKNHGLVAGFRLENKAQLSDYLARRRAEDARRRPGRSL